MHFQTYRSEVIYTATFFKVFTPSFKNGMDFSSRSHFSNPCKEIDILTPLSADLCPPGIKYYSLPWKKQNQC